MTAVATATLLATGATAVPAMAKGGEVGGSGSTYYLSDTFSTEANTVFTYGGPTDQVYVGDWDGDGTDTLAVRRGATFHVRNANSSGPESHRFTYGRPGDVVLVGDWDGDGTDTLAVRRGAVYHVKNDLAGGPADQQVVYGRASDVVLVGDWDGDGDDTFAVRRGAEYHVKNSIAPGRADQVAVYGRAGDQVYVGDFDGDGDDTLTVRRGPQYFIANAIRAGAADRTVVYGRGTDTTMVGDWNGDGTDSLGVRRDARVAGAQDGYDRRMFELINDYRAQNGVPPLRYWDGLRTGALSHSAWMDRNDRSAPDEPPTSFEHASAAVLRADTRAAGCGTGYAENIFWSSYESTPDLAMTEYMNSPGHRANILNRDLGFVATGTILVDGEIFNTQRFAFSCG
ncbi:CAP domain-containing protein [Georgenia subflava]|nr:CAP domain-containing protein [Georgenia subflava]